MLRTCPSMRRGVPLIGGLLATALVIIGLVSVPTSTHVYSSGLSIDVSADVIPPSVPEASHGLEVSWKVTGGTPPYEVTIEITGPDGATEVHGVEELVGTRKFDLAYPSGGVVSVDVNVTDSSGSSGSSMSSAWLSPSDVSPTPTDGEGTEEEGMTGILIHGDGSSPPSDCDSCKNLILPFRGVFESENEKDQRNAFWIVNKMLGRAGVFESDNPLNSSAALYVTNSGQGMGVRSFSVQNIALYGESQRGAAGVYGENKSTTGNGVYGKSDYGKGVYGESVSGTGVYGRSETSPAVWGHSNEHYGVCGVTNSGTAVYGLCGSEGRAGYFDGYVEVYGDLKAVQLQVIAGIRKGWSDFLIDHPLDPENKYLSHSAVESPDMMNIYNGNVVLEENGEVWVELPEWFEALNRDFRYQLTCIGGYAPVYVAQEIAGNRFKIAGGEPGMKVSWQATGIRQDVLANAHRIQVEEEKPQGEKGYYLHPVEWGKPEELGIEYARRAEALGSITEEQEAVSMVEAQ